MTDGNDDDGDDDDVVGTFVPPPHDESMLAGTSPQVEATGGRC